MSKRKKGHEKEPNLERWLVSYADFITLLFAVFVTLYAMSMVDKKKVEEVKASIQSAFGIIPGTGSPVINIVNSSGAPQLQVLDNPKIPEVQPQWPVYAEAGDFARIKEEIEAQLEKAGAQGGVKLAINERGLVISLKEAGFFASGSAEVQPQSKPILDKIAASISGYANDLRVEGHTDNVPISSPTFASNWELSTARACTIVRFLISRGFSGNKLSATGYGEYRPIADNRTEEGRMKNRRVDIVILSQKNTLAEQKGGTEG
ncbi:MAG: OmpA family protein [Desulfobacteraceae bacterium]|nr:OmpA family protein [Desulfobacteraceae bacterium]